MAVQTPSPNYATELLEFLNQPSSYPRETNGVAMKESHISWVFLAGPFAYKLKKPVSFEFLDYSTCDLRKAACEAELRLNRRFSPDVYVSVVPLFRLESGKLTWKETGEVVDWLVKMRRLDDNRTLNAFLHRPETDARRKIKIQTIVDHLARFYATLAPITLRTSIFRDRLRRHVEENEDQLMKIASTESDRNRVRLIHTSQRRFLITDQERLDNRVRDGRIVDGHGDLRPEHIYMYDPPILIDCIEFSEEYRENDIIDELAFLAVECERLGEMSFGRRLLDAYRKASNDLVDDRLIAFYKSYRACVRAKVAALRGLQRSETGSGESPEAEHAYLRLAANYQRALGPRLLIIVGGLIGSGKSTLAGQLQALLSAELVSSDSIRRYAQESGNHTNRSPSAFGSGPYVPAARLANYDALMTAASGGFEKNNVVILDATFSKTVMRERARKLADQVSARLVQVECFCPREESILRIRERSLAGTSDSEALPEFYDRETEESEPPLTGVPVASVDTTFALPQQEAIVLNLVRSIVENR